jgi:hypothetical protein
MAKISKSKLKEILSNINVSEGFVDRILQRIQLSKKKSKSKDLEKQIANNRTAIQKRTIDYYGGYDNIPDTVKKMIEIKQGD